MPTCDRPRLVPPSIKFSQAYRPGLIKETRTFWMIGRIAWFLVEAAEAAARPVGRWLSGTRTGLCLRIALFFCDLPMTSTRCRQRSSARTEVGKDSRRARAAFGASSCAHTRGWRLQCHKLPSSQHTCIHQYRTAELHSPSAHAPTLLCRVCRP
jgi:hypothetical protein